MYCMASVRMAMMTGSSKHEGGSAVLKIEAVVETDGDRQAMRVSITARMRSPQKDLICATYISVC